ncbi:NmrA family NAD(P)-binding protein [Hamadaea tsunoensis]|uniref:NmrA family NAD(P)-binding protein n=1 Tax=Hamadaea tsunoensis TaxID=53368 RepID=UPI000400A172|nr:NmrA family NAD(P)-binding protein [Hamadaea tsunoensis]
MILVTGAAGNVGTHVVRSLLEAGEKVRVMTRDPGQRSFPDGAEVVSGDLARPEALPAALSGVERAFLFPAATGVDAFLDAARPAGVQHVVLLSSSSVVAATPGFLGERHLRIERAVAGSGLPYSFVRPGAFMTNDLAWASQIRHGDVVRGIHGRAASAPIDPRDIAAVAVRALLDPHSGAEHVLTGPQSLSQIERVQIIAGAIGRPLRFEEATEEQYREQMLRYGMPAPVIDQLVAGLGAVSDGRAAAISPAVEQITGRPAFTYASWVAGHAAAFGPAPA